MTFPSGAFDKMEKTIEQAFEALIHSVKVGVYLGTQNIMTDSKRRVPVDWGVLRGSGYVTKPILVGTMIQCELGYGGPAAAYAARVHFVPAHHPEGGEDLYLTKAMDAGRGDFREVVAALGRVALSTKKSGGAMHKIQPVSPWEETQKQLKRQLRQISRQLSKSKR
jgi:hypothetical protein